MQQHHPILATMAFTMIDLSEIRTQVDEKLNRLAADPTSTEIRAHIAFLGQVAAGLAFIDAESLPAEGAGFGSRVTVQDVISGAQHEYVLMVGALVDIDANQVSLASPMGQALLGRMPGDEIAFTTPHKQVKLRVTEVTTLLDQLEGDEVRAARR